VAVARAHFGMLASFCVRARLQTSGSVGYFEYGFGPILDTGCVDRGFRIDEHSQIDASFASVQCMCNEHRDLPHARNTGLIPCSVRLIV
jgi:hypothetical protein